MNKSLIDMKLVAPALKDSFKKLNPIVMIKNPIMFVVQIGLSIALLYSFVAPDPSLRWFNIIVSIILFVTVLFANFAEAFAEGRGKAQANELKKTKKEGKATKIDKNGTETIVPSQDLRKGDIVLVRAGELIPSDGEIIEGIASVDESAITGESATVLKESGGDFSSVTGGTKVISDYLKICITSNPGESFLDQMISMVEGAKRQKTPNEIALNTLLISLTLIFMIVVITLPFLSSYLGIEISVPILIALLVCLIPTTIGGLLSAIGIAGMDRVTQFNVIAMSGKAVEAAGDITTMVLDKTGTITFGNRMACELIPVNGSSKEEMYYWTLIASIDDETPEGRSIIDLIKSTPDITLRTSEKGEFIPFTAETRMSGANLQNNRKVRKGAVDAVKAFVIEHGGSTPQEVHDIALNISEQGGTPLAVAIDCQILGIIHLKDTVKPGMKEKFAELRSMGIKTIMCTGDNPVTARTIAKEAGVDDYVAECKPEDKIKLIKKEQAEGKLVAMTGDGTNDAPALAQADVGLVMNSGTSAAKEAGNMVDLDSDPSKIIQVVTIGKQLLMTRGSLTTFSIANDIAKYFAIIPAIFMVAIPELQALNIMNLSTPTSAILSALIFNAVIIPLLIPLAMRGVAYKPMSSSRLLKRNLFIYGLGGVVTPFIGIKIIDMAIQFIM
ncbi:potassium-transporting ATPase subunit KdpB [Paenalkalicoccus suaedae]|uniref:Potassium-transporting ATPase ATP-binding subunit n=1 Tax=Paenalkalicoccus suaedae TaxID=2592382 RepID=A0A859FAQ3_9BACI|nr:potassium-transporting ATPase subunit KdpB [Paenalkalicoccus suaedae]QKS69868.1 potassium-transporting ATPase subunit KdpB [Paenalkalicoccus suaedae]